MNQSAIDRGIFRATSVKKYQTTIQKNQSTSQDDVFIKPDRSKVAGMRHGTYDKLNEHGYVPEETKIENGDIIIGKVSPIQPVGNSNKTFKDNSESYKSHLPGYVDRVWTGIYDHEGYEMRKMRVRSDRIPYIGDKFCIRDNADVLTENGWKNISEVAINDKVAILVDGKYIKYENPIDVYEFDYNGKMYKLESKFVDLDVTLDHELYVKMDKEFQLIKANDILNKYTTYKKNCVNDNKHVNNVNIQIDNREYIFEANELIHYLIQQYSGYELSNELLSNELLSNELLSKYFDNYKNRLPEFMFNLSQEQAKYFLAKLFNQYKEFHTKSKQFADNLAKLAIHAGISANIEDNNYDYTIKLNDYKYNNLPKIYNTSENVYHYDGKVYCLEVSSHVFMIRLNNKNVWIGNCSRHG